MSCYSYEVIHESKQPILKNVDLTIVLIMEGSKRFERDPFLLNLSKKTILQYNKGFRACKKPSEVIKSNNDIIHAYYTAFEYSKDYSNVIILEEDAKVLNYDKNCYLLVDKYISGNFKVFSFSTHGNFTKKDTDFYYVDVAHGAHAQIFSKNERMKIMNKIKTNNFGGHIDITYLRNNVVTYKDPLIIQLYTETENFNNWDNKMFCRALINLIGADKDKNSWYIIYSYNKLLSNMNAVFLSLLLLLVALLICIK